MAIAMLLVVSCGRHRPEGRLTIEGDSQGIGAVVYVNGHSVGRLRKEWQLWFTSSPLDTITIKSPLGSTMTNEVHGTPVPKVPADSSLVSRLDVFVRMGRGSEVVVVSKSGLRFATRTDLGESTLVNVSFAERRIWATQFVRPPRSKNLDTLSDEPD